jgi:hypothetical protein
MDVNGTRFHLVLGREDWGRCSDERDRELDRVWRAARGTRKPATAWDGKRRELTLQPGVFEFPAAKLDRPPRLSDRRGAGRDRYGNWYWIDSGSDAIRAYSAGSETTSHFWAPSDEDRNPGAPQVGGFRAVTPPPPSARRLVGLAVTDDHYLVVGTRDPGGLLVFDLQSGGPPTTIAWPESLVRCLL